MAWRLCILDRFRDVALFAILVAFVIGFGLPILTWLVASVLRGHRLGHPGVVGWPSRWIGLALPASIAYTALGGIRLIDPAGWIGPPSLVTGGPPAPGVWWWMILAPIFLGVLLFDPGAGPCWVAWWAWQGAHRPCGGPLLFGW